MKQVTKVLMLLLILPIILVPQAFGQELTPDMLSEEEKIWENVYFHNYDLSWVNALYRNHTEQNSTLESENIYPALVELSRISSYSFGEDAEYYDLYLTTHPLETDSSSSDCHIYQSIDEVMEVAEVVPIAYDALVFMVNKNNVVQNITIEQLQQIYTNKIQNWQGANGENSSITAYQRFDTYAQDVMEYIVMRDKEMAVPPVQYIQPNDHGPDVIPLALGYDNAMGSIGYTMHRNFSGRYAQDECKLLMVDGVAPNDDNIKGGQYPFSVTCYAIFSKFTPENHPLRKLVTWLTSVEGQQAIVNAGLIPVCEPMDIPASMMNLPEQLLRSQSFGTADTLMQTNEELPDYLQELYSIDLICQGTSFPCHNELVVKEGAFKKKIEDWIALTKHEFQEQSPDKDETFETYYYYYQDLISVYVSYGRGYDLQMNTAVFHYPTCEKLDLSDLFYQGINYIDYINKALVTKSMQRGPEVLGGFAFKEDNLKQAFIGLPADYSNFLVSEQGELCIVFEAVNPYVHVSYWEEIFPIGVALDDIVSPYGS